MKKQDSWFQERRDINQGWFMIYIMMIYYYYYYY